MPALEFKVKPTEAYPDAGFDIVRGRELFGRRRTEFAAEDRAQQLNDLVAELGRDVTVADLDEQDWAQLHEAAAAFPDTLSSESRPRLAFLHLVGDVACSALEAPLALATYAGRMVAATREPGQTANSTHDSGASEAAPDNPYRTEAYANGPATDYTVEDNLENVWATFTEDNGGAEELCEEMNRLAALATNPSSPEPSDWKPIGENPAGELIWAYHESWEPKVQLGRYLADGFVTFEGGINMPLDFTHWKPFVIPEPPVSEGSE